MDVVSEHHHARPAPALRPFVAHYSGYRDVGVAPERHRGLPSPYLTLIVTLDEPLTMLEAAGTVAFDTLVAGLHTAPVTVVHEGRQSGVQLALHPIGAHALLGCPAGALGTDNLVAADVAPGWVATLQDRLRTATDWPARFHVLDEVLTAVVQPATIDRSLVRAWHALSVQGVPVAVVADRLGWNPRRLSRAFGAEFGVSPKTAARLGRFDRARRDLLTPGPPPVLAEVAARHGYYDQAHLAREFRDLAGVAPSGWLAESRRFVQADPAAALAGSSS